jgi:hypothetical protein
MITQNKFRLLMVMIVALVLVNAGTLAYLWSEQVKQQTAASPDPARFLAAELQLDTTQTEAYYTYWKEYRNKLKMLHSEGKLLHISYFAKLSITPIDTAEVQRYADSIAAYRRKVELLSFYQFSRVRQLCTPPQRKKFDLVIGEVLGMMAMRPPKPPAE